MFERSNCGLAVGSGHFRALLAGGLMVGASLMGATVLAQDAVSVHEILVLEDNAKLDGNLGDVLVQTGANEKIRVVAVMREQADRDVIRNMRRPGVTKAERRVMVTTLLKDVAAGSQGPLLDYLVGADDAGRAASVRPLWISNVVGFEATPDVVFAVAARDDVAYVHYDPPRGAEILTGGDPMELGGDPGTDGLECGVDVMEADRVWDELNITGNGVVVCVIDTGLCITHPDIANQVWENPGETPGNGQDDDNNGFIDDVYGWNFENDNNNINDLHGHGSHVSGTVAGDGTSGTQAGMAPDAQIMTARFWNSFSGEQTVWDGMQYALDNGADVSTASLGWPHSMGPDRVTWRNVCENTIAGGVVVLYASGNEGCGNPPDNVRTPGDVPDVITVGATDCSDNIASFSSCGPVTWQGIVPFDDCPYPPGCIKPTISAPGVNTTSHATCSGYTQMSGTSMATPHAAGAVALILEANPALDHFDVKAILEASAVDLGASGKDNTFGAGRIDVYEAVLLAGGITPSCMNLSVENLVAGETATFTLSKDLTRGEAVAILWGTGGNPSNVNNVLDYCATFGFNLGGNPFGRIVARGFVDSNEVFVAKKAVPSGVAGMSILFQGAKAGTCPDECMSDLVDMVVQ